MSLAPSSPIWFLCNQTSVVQGEFHRVCLSHLEISVLAISEWSHEYVFWRNLTKTIAKTSTSSCVPGLSCTGTNLSSSVWHFSVTCCIFRAMLQPSVAGGHKTLLHFLTRVVPPVDCWVPKYAFGRSKSSREKVFSDLQLAEIRHTQTQLTHKKTKSSAKTNHPKH